jgi:hypothetical protein
LQYNHNIDPVMIYGARVTLQNCSELKWGDFIYFLITNFLF